MDILTENASLVNPYVSVVRDGQVYRWLRFDGRTRRTSTDAFPVLSDALSTAVVIAQCYSVPSVGLEVRSYWLPEVRS
jgi:hypothetical protein